jgi:hypothetical protein
MSSDEQRAFWTAIRCSPEDDAARLIYADWLGCLRGCYERL